MNRCRECGRVDAEMGTCGRFATCPAIMGERPQLVNPDRDVVLMCHDADCNITRVVSVDSILAGKPPKIDHVCPHPSRCRCVCVVLRQEVTVAAPPLEELFKAEEAVVQEFSAEEVEAAREASASNQAKQKEAPAKGKGRAHNKTGE